MKRTFTLAAALLMVVAAAVPASAEMVNTGVVEMEKTEVEYLQGLVSGSRTFAAQNPAAETQAAEDLGLVDMSAEDLTDVRDYVSGRTEFKPAPGKVSGEKTVNTGRVEMPASEHAAIEKMATAGRAQRLAKLNALLHK